MSTVVTTRTLVYFSPEEAKEEAQCSNCGEVKETMLKCCGDFWCLGCIESHIEGHHMDEEVGCDNCNAFPSERGVWLLRCRCGDILCDACYKKHFIDHLTAYEIEIAE